MRRIAPRRSIFFLWLIVLIGASAPWIHASPSAVVAAASAFRGYLDSVTPKVDPDKRDDRVAMTRIIIADIGAQEKKLDGLWQMHLRNPDERYRLRFVQDCLADLEKDVRSALDEKIWVEGVDAKTIRTSADAVLSAMAEFRDEVSEAYKR
ncbi:MAG TPA: hypothetical protein VFT72_03520 [Opitutaceae bacterium]|nr:hypothetical protein [Opitutaceae bacterium]